jgi:hypothetical protein
MKKNSLTFFIILILPLYIFAQKTDKGILNMGIFIGEGTGVLVNYSISNKFNIEWDVAYHEIFYKYKYTDKYKDLYIYQEYDNIFSSSLLFNYKNKFMNVNKLKYHLAIGVQSRIIPKYYTILDNSSLPPDVIGINDPITRTKLDLGIYPLIGLEYWLNNNISLFIDIGGYIEIIDVFLWSNLQYRIGISYYFNKKVKSEYQN